VAGVYGKWPLALLSNTECQSQKARAHFADFQPLHLDAVSRRYAAKLVTEVAVHAAQDPVAG